MMMKRGEERFQFLSKHHWTADLKMLKYFVLTRVNVIYLGNYKRSANREKGFSGSWVYELIPANSGPLFSEA